MKILLYGISAAMLVFLILYSGIGEMLDALWKLDITILLALLVLTALYTLLRTYRFYFLLQRKYSIKFSSLLPIYLYGIGLSNVAPARFSEPIRALLLKTEKNIPFTFGMACVFFERLSDMLILTFLAAFAFLFVDASIFSIFIVPFLFAFLLILFAIFATQYGPAYAAFMFVFTKFSLFFRRAMNFAGIKSRKVESAIAEIGRAINTLRTELRISRVFVHPLVVSLLVWVVDGLTFYLPLRAMGYDIGFPTVLAAYALSLLVGLVTFLPGGFGSVEVTLTLLLLSFGVAKAPAVTATLLGRFFGLGIIVCISVFLPYFITKESIKEHKTKK